MEKNVTQNIAGQKKTFMICDGKLYFSKASERKFFFVLTVVMLIWGIFSKIGLL
jgi:hypothetical protein